MNRQADCAKRWGEFCQQLTGAAPDTRLLLLVLAAHPDDETIGASVVLARFPQSSVVFLTDGAPRDISLWSAGVHGSREEYAQTRRQEAIRALAEAGIPESQMFCLAAVDQEAIFEISRLAQSFQKLLCELHPDVVITHAYEGGHPDHDSAALVADIAISRRHEAECPLLVEMTSYHAVDERCVTGEFLTQDSSTECFVELSETGRERKQRMIESYASQRLVLKNFPVDRERLRAGPGYDFSEPPHDGKLWYECMGWAMSGRRWRELASAALASRQEELCR